MELINQIDQTMSFDKKTIRIVGTYENPWFVVKDICKILGIQNNRDVIKLIPDKWKSNKFLPSLGGNQNTSIINEAGLYKLIMRSNKPIAQKFQEVVCEEILPTLRKKGEYKIQSIIDKVKELEDEKVQLEEENLRLEEDKLKLQEKTQDVTIKLIEEQKVVIKTKKSLELNQKKFTHRYKFNEECGCVYILKDPENPLNKFKIGYAEDIDVRLTSDRTMIPKIKALYIMYTPHFKIFETLIKIRFEEHFQFQSHEWIILDKFENVNFIINGYKEIDKACNFKSKIEDNLWQYNLEAPPASYKITNKDRIEKMEEIKIIKKIEEPEEVDNLTEEADNELFDTNHFNFAGKLSMILPTYLLRYDYDKKNEVAGEGYRYCNGYCQGYQNIELFPMKSLSPLTICMKCDSKIDVANVKISNGILTPAEIRKNPLLLELKDNEKICRKCFKIKDKDDFPEKRRQCKACRNKVRSKFGKDFESHVESEVDKLNKTKTIEELMKLLDVYVKDELHKILQFLEITRKFNDTKEIIKNKIFEYYVKRNNI